MQWRAMPRAAAPRGTSRGGQLFCRILPFTSRTGGPASTVSRVSLPPAPLPGGPPPPGRWQRLRSWRAARHALPRFGFWLLSRGAVVLGMCGALYVLNGFLIGWANAYDVMTGITSPKAVHPQWCAWLLSLTGWAAIPAVIGAAAGYVITEQIRDHHSRELSDVVDELRRLAEPSSGGDS
ncbi:DUF6313 family protein [Streptomyces olivaceoviridis]|uniref:DUF6313 family protein n=2 Tax=Streptomyces olivaceoviridis TaxID=1921 RepID=UPI0037A46973